MFDNANRETFARLELADFLGVPDDQAPECNRIQAAAILAGSRIHVGPEAARPPGRYGFLSGMICSPTCGPSGAHQPPSFRSSFQ
ncbi:hypothetical protein [Massilia scottii]|uniref:hypothetical protein n=1 Tax=Massilia scottii TaxID=3057166 RepID=UPI0027969F5C|nr:hypothetical protein [Massilia sp. CCM 9029]MDQ1832878.1 hypothetical protein [Massilia sp. CCM 9029]